METLEIHSKSFLIKWVEAPTNSLISWQVHPKKKSINFGVFRHIGGDDRTARPSINNSNNNLSLEEQLDSAGLRRILWHGRCISNELLRGHYNVSQGGMFALVFDNTFSKNTAKTVQFSQHVSTRNGSEVDLSQSLVESSAFDSDLKTPYNNTLRTPSGSSSANVSNPKFTTEIRADFTADQVHVVATEPYAQNGKSNQPTCVHTSRYLSGILLKKRRKKLQGYGRRYFSLDYKYAVLNYYLEQKSSLLRGSMPIKLCVVSAIAQSRDIIIDSGAEIWYLRALNEADFKAWSTALDHTRNSSVSQSIMSERSKSVSTIQVNDLNNNALPGQSHALDSTSIGHSGWYSDFSKELTHLMDELNRTRGLLNTALSGSNGLPVTVSDLSLNESIRSRENVSPGLSPSIARDDNTNRRRASIWKRKKSSPTIETEKSPRAVSSGNSSAAQFSLPHVREANDRIDNVVKKIENLIKFAEIKHQAAQASPDSEFNDQSSFISGNERFYDATDNFGEGVVYIEEDEDNPPYLESPTANDSNEDTESDNDSGSFVDISTHKIRLSILSESIGHKEADTDHDMYPLPLKPVERRRDIMAAVANPPSIIGLLRKNVGKDLSSVTMPVTSNEPVTMLQRYSELMEYSHLLDDAAKTKEPDKALLLISAFSVSQIANQRAKERSQRKPFNPLLGETFELVREDKGFRLIGEKVCHKPLIMAFHAESLLWTVKFTCMPKQQFWGKSIEITDGGTFQVLLKPTGSFYEFSQPSTFLRNLIAGEKYVEPQGVVTIDCSNGFSSEVRYLKPQSSGLFGGGRSEGVAISIFDNDGKILPLSAAGKWTDKLHERKGDVEGKEIWHVGQLLPDSKKKYGFTEFTASLNEITEIEKELVSPTDSRMRPDQRAYENGNVDRAETLKLQYEEDQRTRRKAMETEGISHVPAFFDKQPLDNGDEFYVLKTGSNNYWERRKKSQWDGLVKLW